MVLRQRRLSVFPRANLGNSIALFVCLAGFPEDPLDPQSTPRCLRILIQRALETLEQFPPPNNVACVCPSLRKELEALTLS